MKRTSKSKTKKHGKKPPIPGLVSRMRALQLHSDTEMAHVDADELLCEALEMVGWGDLVREWRRVGKWYS